MLQKIEVRRAVAPDEQVHIATGICFPGMIDLWRNNDVVTDLKRLPFCPQNMCDLSPQDDGILSVRVPM